ncbi:MAG: AraC family transcriptional regulator [Lentisphaeraceae bacterium]|nr:AraC family transcriptional regulator [Lentisphaeraceae bacterium]
MKRDTPIIVRALPDSGILYIKSSHSDNFSMDMGIWPFRKICWIEAGTGTLEFENSSLSFTQGDILLIDADIPHKFIDVTPCTLAIICYDENALPSSSRSLHEQLISSLPMGKKLTISDPWRWNYLHQQFKANLIEQSNKHVGYSEMLKANLMTIVTFLYRAVLSQDSNSANDKSMIIKGLVNYLERNFVNDISVEDLADMSKLSVRSLSRHFKEQTGKTIVQKITELRIHYACERLKETKQITFSAFDAGFNDISFFYRVFKKHVGVTPKQYVKSITSMEQ